MTLLLAILFAAFAASDTAGPRDAIVGAWRGTSTCVDLARFPACKDEVVIYEFRLKGDDTKAVTLAASKVVDGRVGLMGEMDFTFDAAQGAWLSEFQNGRVHILWSLVVHGRRIEGTAVDLPDRHLVRRVAVEKQP